MFHLIGQSAPWFKANSTTNPRFCFDTVAGRYVLLCFLKSSNDKASQIVLKNLATYRKVFDDKLCSFFGVSIDPEDQKLSRLKEQIPGIRFFWDFDQAISRKFGVVEQDNTYHLCTYILDERLRVLSVLPFANHPENHVLQLISILSKLPKLSAPTMASVQAPILVVPRIFEPKLCQALIAYYDQHGGEESGFMRESQGRTKLMNDERFKRRRDQEILDEELRNAAMFRIHDRLAPEIYKAFQFQATYIERHIIACYESENQGFFTAHRDNTTKGTAHRKFAVSVNLNTGEYEGGCLKFPEFGRQTYTVPAGGAIVFSCSLLHEATPVTKGSRYAYLPFLYDDAAAKVREMNQKFVDYKA
ncbi:putative iron-regulated protein [Xenococcus sp. PCC 7305]|uniref:2OG-Fe(II) oxygenase n=1 Tax=Xenococcus sp. PCC 7305 TaxID=102125 RepID=UPI0002AC88BB|nr:2OG-Fe(II) oxygenase [Xenococcus sp. PCC 7305]ELS01732.1 putative iron-regulated protein [Xenococcus sp. PCC 7305]